MYYPKMIIDPRARLILRISFQDIIKYLSCRHDYREDDRAST